MKKHRIAAMILAVALLGSGCAGAGSGRTSSGPASSEPVSSQPAEPTETGFETVGYYAFWTASQADIDFWKACGIDTVLLLDLGWFYDPAQAGFDNYYQSLTADIARVQQNGMRAFVVLLTNLQQYHGPYLNGNGSGVVFDPADETQMAERLGYIEHTIRQCATADGFELFAGDPGGVSGLRNEGGLDVYLTMHSRVQALVRQYAPNAAYNLNLWAVSQQVQGQTDPLSVAFWQGETANARELIARDGLFGPEVGVEIPGHDYYRALAFSVYRAAGAFPAERFPTAADIAALRAKNTPRIWAFSYFLLDELDEGGTGYTKLPAFNTRYIAQYLTGMRAAGMNGAIAGTCAVQNAANLFAFARMARDATLTPAAALRAYAGAVATEETADALCAVMQFVENDANWHRKLPEEDRLPLFETDIASPEQALTLLRTVQPRDDGAFPLPVPAEEYLIQLRRRVEKMLPARQPAYPYVQEQRVYLAQCGRYDGVEDPRTEGSTDGWIRLGDDGVGVYNAEQQAPADLSRARNAGGSLHVSLYAARDTGSESVGYLQLSDWAEYMAVEHTVTLALPPVRAGWNEITVPLSAATTYISPLSSWSAVRGCRIVALGQPGDELYVNNLYVE